MDDDCRGRNRVRTESRARDEFVGEYSAPRIITQYKGLLLSTRDYPDFCLHNCITSKPSVFRPDDGFCLLSCYNSDSLPKGDGRECVFSRDNHKTASWVIDKVIGLLIKDRISFAGPLQVCNAILRDNYFMRFVGLPVHRDSQIPNFFTFYVLTALCYDY